jgi:transposase
MIPAAAGVRIWIASGHTDMRKGMNGLALLVQEGLGRDPSAGDVFVFRGRAGSLIKALWHDGIGLSLYAKRLDRGRFVWPATVDGVVALSAAQMSYLLEAIDWRNPQNIPGDRRARARLKKAVGCGKKSPQSLIL